MTTLEQAAAALEAAQRRYEAQRVTLFAASDGKTPIYQPEEHDRRLYEMRKPLALAAEEAQEAAAAAIEGANRKRLDSLYSCPTRDMKPEDLAEANALRPFVAEECQRLPLADLAERLRWAAAGLGGEARNFLYRRYAQERLTAERAKTPAPAGLPELSAAVRDLQDGRALSERKHAIDEELSDINLRAFQLRARAAQALADGKPRPALTL